MTRTIPLVLASVALAVAGVGVAAAATIAHASVTAPRSSQDSPQRWQDMRVMHRQMMTHDPAMARTHRDMVSDVPGMQKMENMMGPGTAGADAGMGSGTMMGG